ncbi:MAG: exosortase/archaeosortase family protein [Pedosphaera sp.]|nr:exosortase/archaeosortase family protein [Pedosphaera sp.]
MSDPNTAAADNNSGGDGFAARWRRLPNKELFFPLLAAWLLFFHFLGNSTFGYVDTPSLFHWMYNAYNSTSPTADDGHGNLIPFVVLGLFWWKRKELLELPLATWWPGILLVAVAVVMHVVGYLVQQPRVCIMALFAGIYGLMGLAWGVRFLKASFFPFFLLLLMVPLGSLTEPVTFPLRLMVSKIVAFICNHVLAISVLSQGTSLRSPMGYQYEVAAACSGIRSLVAIAAIAIIYAFMVFRQWPLRLVLLASAIPLAVIGNTFRMMVIVLAAEFGGQSAGNRAHESAFWSLLPYVPAIIGLMLLGRWLEKLQDRKAKKSSETSGEVKPA